MSAPQWQAATPGQATLAGHLNQFLVGHSSSFAYEGSAIGTDPTLATTADQLGAGMLAFKIPPQPAATDLSRIDLALGAIGSGADVVVSLQGDSGSGTPSGVMLAAQVVPAEWLSAGVAQAASLWSVALGYTLAASTPYYIVCQHAAYLNGALVQALAGINDVQLTRSTASTGAMTYNPSTQAWTSEAYGYGVYLRTGVADAIRVISDDNPALAGPWSAKTTCWSLNASGYLETAYEYVGRSPGAPMNLLCRDDASFEGGLGGTTAVSNCSVAQSSAQALYGSHSMAITASAAGNCTVRSGTYPVGAGLTYSAVVSLLAASTPRDAELSIVWLNSSGAVIETTTGAEVEDGTQWTQLTVSGAAPTGAVSAYLTTEIVAAAASEVHYEDGCGLFAGTNTLWSLPGTTEASVRTASYSGSLLIGFA